MSEFDDRVRRSLRQQGELMHDTPAPAELTDRIVRKERRTRRGLTVGLVVALLAGPTLGFVAGSGGGDGAEPTRRTASAAAGTGVVIHDDKVPKIAGAAALSAGKSEAPSASDGATTITEGKVVAAEGLSFSVASGGVYFGSYGVELARFFDRDANGAKVRVYHADVESPISSGPPWWKPADWCFPSGVVQADVSNDDVVGIVSGSVYNALRASTLGGSLGLVGVSERAPQWVAIVQSTTDVAKIRVTFPGGATDEMKPVDGVAVLVGAAQVTQDQLNQGFLDSGASTDMKAHAQSLDSSGAVVAEADVSLYGGLVVQTENDGCAAPLALPAPGVEQPADPEAARAEIASHFGGAGGASKVSDILGNLDDPRGMEETWNELINGSFGEQAKAAETQFKDVVFLSATKAAVQYDIHIPNYMDFSNRFAEYVLVDGKWKETRESLCRDIALAGVTCKPAE
jgi:hypothetical protein